MKTQVYLTVGSKGSVRATKKRTAMRAGEVGVRLTLDIPDAAFRQPFAEAHLEVPDGFVIKPDLDVWLDPIEGDERESE